MKNPIEVIREKHGYNRTQFGVVCGVVSETVRQVERGTIKSLAPSFIEALERLGYDAEQVLKDLEAWRDHYKEELLSKAN